MKRRAERRLRFRLVFQTSASENTCASVKVDGAAVGRRFEGPVPLALEMRPRNVCTGGATSCQETQPPVAAHRRRAARSLRRRTERRNHAASLDPLIHDGETRISDLAHGAPGNCRAATGARSRALNRVMCGAPHQVLPTQLWLPQVHVRNTSIPRMTVIGPAHLRQGRSSEPCVIASQVPQKAVAIAVAQKSSAPHRIGSDYRKAILPLTALWISLPDWHRGRSCPRWCRA
jgi:hypothetical protein